MSLHFINNFPGAVIHMVCRNQSKGEEAKQDIIRETGNEVN